VIKLATLPAPVFFHFEGLAQWERAAAPDPGTAIMALRAITQDLNERVPAFVPRSFLKLPLPRGFVFLIPRAVMKSCTE
jgi:hypothetical protein